MSELGRVSETILVADDEESVREILSDLLRESGYRVIAVEDGRAALQAFRQYPIDLALLDVVMPYADGFAVCKGVKSSADTRLLPVVLVTGLNNREDRLLGIECGADDFLSKPVEREELLARVRSLLRIKHYTDELENAETVLCSLALSIEAKDPYTQGHCDRLSIFSVALADAIGMKEPYRVALRRAGIVHDIGKVAVPDDILLKPGPLTSEERHIMEQHPVVGARICAPLRSFRLVYPIIRHHHERMDGTGYPDRLKGDQIPMTARVLQAVDIYDALTTDRPYRRGLKPQEAIEALRDEVRRGWRDGDVVEAWARILPQLLANGIGRGTSLAG